MILMYRDCKSMEQFITSVSIIYRYLNHVRQIYWSSTLMRW